MNNKEEGSDSKPFGENDPAPAGEKKADVEATHANIDIPPSLSAPGPPPTPTHCHITCNPEKDWWDKCKPFVEVAGIVILAVYTTYTIKMYWANKKAADAAKSAADTAWQSLKDARESIKGDQRAWVSIAKFELKEEPAEGKKIKVDFSLINTGKTPAMNCVVLRMPWMLNGSPPKYANDLWPNKPINTPSFVVMPVGDQSRTYPWEVPQEGVRHYRQKTSLLYVLVKIWYDDVFGGHHWATACRWHEFNTPLNEFWPCFSGTDTDNPYQQSK